MQLGIVALLGIVSGCYSGFESAQGQLHFDPGPWVVLEPFAGLIPGETLLLEGTEVCAAVRCSDADASCPRDIDVAACFEPSVEGGSVSGPLCAVAETAGTFVWHFDPVAEMVTCGGPSTYEPQADEVSFEVVPKSEVTPVLLQWAERGADAGLIPAGADAFPDDWTVADGEPFQVVIGGTLQLPVAFLTNDDDRIVAWDANSVIVEVVTTAGSRPEEAVPDPGWIAITPTGGSISEIQVTDVPVTWVAGTVHGIDPERVQSLEIVVALATEDDEGDFSSPFGARAVLRDADGALVYGAPVTWELVDGNVLLEVDDDQGLPGADYIGISDACVPPSPNMNQLRRATIQASYRGLTSTVTFEWLVPPSSAEFFPDEDCAEVLPDGEAADDKGCACDQSGAPGVGLAMLVGWLVRRRRTG